MGTIGTSYPSALYGESSAQNGLFEVVYNDRCIRETDCCRVLADEELIDPKKYLEDSCKPKCVKPLLEYEACVKRVERDDSGHKHCTGQYFDYWFCIDKCVAPKLFSKLK
ncbi:UBIQUINOL-CYTOCHROME C REDUCTASE COMPLEX 7.8 KDA PROTEIN [Salix viminalis]|uniref:Complex III subunit VI n=1 Tax=Salix viminalis TaxID=40686 RepID=A0A9Q0UIM0_SALVM|nr:UBIQUINOL-CYTOCHROME C REDUCTASE COMPLEX 7.8 KDA PROTEIN [Salix viminalis]